MVPAPMEAFDPRHHARQIPRPTATRRSGCCSSTTTSGAFDPYVRARLLIGMCMDNRKVLRTPDNFAYVIRGGGANTAP